MKGNRERWGQMWGDIMYVCTMYLDTQILSSLLLTYNRLEHVPAGAGLSHHSEIERLVLRVKGVK